MDEASDVTEITFVEELLQQSFQANGHLQDRTKCRESGLFIKGLDLVEQLAQHLLPGRAIRHSSELL